MKAPGFKASVVKPSENKGHYNIAPTRAKSSFLHEAAGPGAQLLEELQSSQQLLCSQQECVRDRAPRGCRNRTTHVPSRPFTRIVQVTIQAGDAKTGTLNVLSPRSEGKKSGSCSISSPHCREESTGPCSTFNTVIKTIKTHPNNSEQRCIY